MRRQTRSRTFSRAVTAAVVLAAAGAPLLTASQAQASPQDDVDAAKAKLAALQDQAEAATERWHNSQIQLTKAQAQLASAQQALVRSQAAVSGQRSLVASAASATYKAGALGQIAIFVGSSDPQQFLDRAADLGQVAHGRSESIAALSSVVKQQSDAQALLDQATKVAKSAADTADSEKAAVDSSVNEQKSVLADALAKQAEIVREAQAAAARADAAHKAAAEAAAAAAAQAQTDLQAQQTATTVVDDPNPPDDSAPVQTGSGVAAVIAAARAELGKPYVYGAAGPNVFDCSGLTMWAYRAAGVSLPHYTGAQVNMGRRVSVGNLAPGDLVFFYGDYHHVGLYVGGGQMIEAPHTGAYVRLVPLRSGITAAVRIFN